MTFALASYGLGVSQNRKSAAPVKLSEPGVVAAIDGLLNSLFNRLGAHATGSDVKSIDDFNSHMRRDVGLERRRVEAGNANAPSLSRCDSYERCKLFT